MDLEQIVQQILMAKRDLSRKEVLKKIYEKKRSSEDYFLDEVAARIVAAELGIKVSGEFVPKAIKIKDLVSGLSDVTLIGRVIIIHPIQTFSRPDLTKGKVTRLLLADKTGTLRVVLWNDKIIPIEDGKIRQDQIIEVSHGYMREGLDGKLELNIGERGEVKIAHRGITEAEYPAINDFVDKIGNLIVKNKATSVVGLVQDVYPTSEFKRQNGTIGKVRRLRLRDNTGKITAVFWNEKVNELGEVKRDEHLRIMNAKVKETINGGLELHIDHSTQIQKLVESEISIHIQPFELVKINELQLKINDVSFLARVTKITDIKEFKRPNGETGKIATLELMDATGTVQLNLWNEKAEMASQIQVGDVVLCENAYTRQRLGKTQVNLRAKGSLKINPPMQESLSLPPFNPLKDSFQEEKAKIADIQNEGGPFTIEATVATTPTIREIVTSRNEKVLVAFFDIADEAGKIRVSLWRQLAEIAKQFTIGTRIVIKNVYAKKGFSNLVELISHKSTIVEIKSNP